MVTIERYNPKQYLNKCKTMSAINTSDDTLTTSTEEDENSRLYPYTKSSEDDDDDLDDEQENNTIAICDCGRQLDSGWQCSHCRRACPICNRSLSLNPEEYCERCFRICKYHGLYSISSGSVECPLCS